MSGAVGSDLGRGGEGVGEKEEEGKIEGRGTDPQNHLNSDFSTDNYNCLVIYLLDTSTTWYFNCLILHWILNLFNISSV